jgi:hypothetical protein
MVKRCSIISAVLLILFVLMLVLLMVRCTAISPKMGDKIVLERRQTDTLTIVGGRFKDGVFHYTVRYVRKNGTWYEYEVSKQEPIKLIIK